MSRNGGVGPSALVWVAALLVVAGSAVAVPVPAVVTVTFSEGGHRVDITSTKDISNVIIEYCDGTNHTHEFTGALLVWNHTETQVIAGVWVKSGNNGNGTGPPGAGQRFDNPDADAQCAEQCLGPENVAAVANEDETVTVSWDAYVGAESYKVYRAVGAGSFEAVATPDGNTTTYIDENVTNGVTYRYHVTAFVGGQESDFCETAEVTAIPDLPTLFAGGMAAVAGIGAYAMLRRRRA